MGVLTAAALQMPPTLLAQPTVGVAPDQAHRAAFQDVNRALRASKIDDSLSGTTAITALVRGSTLLVANVGDSRACMAEQHGRKLTAFNLSCDQTPFRCVLVGCAITLFPTCESMAPHHRVASPPHDQQG
jgi:serine/threonine protein phosphatase PrpC